MRFLLPITPFLAVLAAEASKRLTLTLRGMGMRRGRFFLFSALTILFLLNLPPFLPLHEVDREGWKGWLTHVIRTLPVRIVSGRESQDDYLTRSVPSYASWRYINTHVPKNACILTFSGGDNYYSERRRIWSDATLARPATWGASAGEEKEALQALADLGISHVLFDKRLLRDLPPGSFAIAQSSILNTWYEREYEDRGFVLYRIRWDWMTHQPEIQR